jgi:N-methylhydantoinase A
LRIGIECGGTFTDLVVVDDHGNILATNKVLSTADNPAIAVIEALEGVDPQLREAAHLLHGSTVATNALLERKGGPIGLISTRGFGDVLFLQRQDRSHMYDLSYVKPKPLVASDDIYEISERTTSAGEVLVDLDVEDLPRIAEALIQTGVTAVAVSLLHSYARPEHEIIVRDELVRLGVTVPIALSHEVVREFREFERTSTTTVDAFIRPRVGGYLEFLNEYIASQSIESLQVMQSNAGLVPPHGAIHRPITMLLSGPAAGVSGAITIAERSGLNSIVTMDMGGTSTDVAFISDFEPDLKTDTMVDGLPIRVPLIDIHTVGAGGGSLIGIDGGGLLTVGPESAGANPGPACFGRGGTHPTITDANLLVGIMPLDTKMAGKLHLDAQAARDAFAPLAAQLGRSVEDIAEEALRLANTHMAGAIREASLEQGYELEGTTLIAYGGAGAMHAAHVADETGITSILVPPYSGLTSAYGLLTAAFRRDFVRTWFHEDFAAADASAVSAYLDTFITEATSEIAAQGIPVDGLTASWSLDMRYRGQGFELPVPLTPSDLNDLGAIVDKFHTVHERRFGHSSSDRPAQLVSVRLQLVGERPSLAAPHTPHTDAPPVTASAYLGGRSVSISLVERGSIQPGTVLPGPLVVRDVAATTYVPPQWSTFTDLHGNLIVTKGTP